MRVTKDELRDILAPLIERFRAYVDEKVAAIPAGKDGAQGPKGDPGPEADLDPLRRAISAEIAHRFDEIAKAIPEPRDGKDGRDGKDADPAVIRAEVLEAVAKAVSEIPAPRDGAPGKDGEPGKDGKSVTSEDVAPMLEAAFAKWALDFERRAADVLQRAAERIPVPKDGVDGMSVEDLTVTDDGDGRVTFRFSRGEVSREFTVRIPRFKDMGVYREGQAHQEGDGVSSGGSFWIAQQDDPPGRPGDPDSGWRLAVKKGRDGKDSGGAAPPAPRGPVRTP